MIPEQISACINTDEAVLTEKIMSLAYNESLSKEVRQIAIWELIENEVESKAYSEGYATGMSDAKMKAS